MSNNESNEKEKRFDTSLPRATSMHVLFLVIVGAFFTWQVIQLIYDTANGLEEMSTASTVALVIVMGLIAVVSFVFAGYAWYCIRKNRKAKAQAEAEAAAEAKEAEEAAAEETEEENELLSSEGDEEAEDSPDSGEDYSDENDDDTEDIPDSDAGLQEEDLEESSDQDEEKP